MKRAAIFFLLLTALPALAQPQAGKPPTIREPETIYSEADRQKDELLSRKFVTSLLAPSLNLEGQFSRWKQPLCPRVFGMTPLTAYVVERRIRDVALTVGAPLDRADPCRPNVVIAVTPEPQAMLDALVAKDHWLFDAAPLRELKVHYPVQAWYEGLYRDYNGVSHLDVPWELLCPSCLTPPPTPVNDTRLRLGVQPEMGTATILVDANAVNGLTLGTLGDYLALMALAQTPANGRCQPAPSIANLFLTDCGNDLHTTGLSEADLAMLTSLYQTPDEPEKLQMVRLIGNMRRNLEGRK
ncbi:MAG: hypothetical protein JO256_07490 [Alphaproteobacteria bacterium]|nr:hypothetical protein [Alphaproteobacteria bacterium]